jgi:hypothetical protein
LHSSDVEFRLTDVEDNIMTYIEISLVYLEQSIIIVFSLYLREPLVLDLVIDNLDTMTGCSGSSFFLGIFMFLFMFFILLLGPWSFL